MAILLLNTWNKLHVCDILIQQELIYDLRLINIAIRKKRENIELGFVLAAQFHRSHDRLKTPLSCRIIAIMIMIFLRPVKADADEEIISAQELTPLVV